MATTIRRRVQVGNGTLSTNLAYSSSTSVKVRTITNVTRVEASTADWYTLNNQIESNSEKINSLETKVDNLDERFSTFEDKAQIVIDKADQISYLLDKDLLTYNEIGA